MGSERTDSHNNQESCAEPPKINHGVAAVLHKIIWISAATTYPVRDGSKNIGRDNEESEVVVKEGCRENDEEETDS